MRSSSLLEDSQYQPFTGVYETFMLPNNDGRVAERLRAAAAGHQAGLRLDLLARHAKAYLRATPYRLEEEKMAVILQQVVGAPHGARFYPDFSGRGALPQLLSAPADAAARTASRPSALGLGRGVVEGARCLRFCPRYPQHLLQFSSVEDMLDELAARVLGAASPERRPKSRACARSRFSLDVAEADGTLAAVASTYSPENDAVYDGLSRPGVRLVTLRAGAQARALPRSPTSSNELLRDGRAGHGRAGGDRVRGEPARARRRGPRSSASCRCARWRLSREAEELELGEVAPASARLPSSQRPRQRPHRRTSATWWSWTSTASTARRAARRRPRSPASTPSCSRRGVPYLLIGVGRWGSRDPWLGIPVTWDQIAGARVIVEAGLRDFQVTPSQGSHFFQNLTSFHVGYFTVNEGDGFVDWDWLAAQPA